MKIAFTSLLFFISGVCYADTFVCPGSYQTIMTGFTMDQVTAACGKPTQVNEQTETQTTTGKLEQWVFSLPSITLNKVTVNTPQLLVTFDNGQVTEITTNRMTGANFFSCYYQNRIKIGSSKADVVSQCGYPLFVNSIQRAGQPQSIPIITWTYNNGPYQPQTTVTFRDGKVTTIRTSIMGK
jgi:hypothetical protein